MKTISYLAIYWTGLPAPTVHGTTVLLNQKQSCSQGCLWQCLGIFLLSQFGTNDILLGGGHRSYWTFYNAQNNPPQQRINYLSKMSVLVRLRNTFIPIPLFTEIPIVSVNNLMKCTILILWNNLNICIFKDFGHMNKFNYPLHHPYGNMW